MAFLIIDLAAYPIDGATEFIQAPSAPSNYKDPDKIAAYITERRSELERSAALDIDLARISAIGIWDEQDGATEVWTCRDDHEERVAISRLVLRLGQQTTLIGFNSLKYDWPLLMRRCLYLGLPPIYINLDRYRSPHVDLWNELSCNGLVTAHSLTWYAKRLGWTDLQKPLSGADEALAPSRGQWLELAESVRHDVEAARRLAVWARILTPSAGEAV